MRKYLNQLLIIIALIIVGCSDPCKDAVCGPGVCDDGTCICPDGYEGASCDALQNAKNFGLYYVIESDCSGGTQTLYPIQFTIEPKIYEVPFGITIILSVSGDPGFILTGTLMNGKVDVSGILNSALITLKGDFTDPNTLVGVFEIPSVFSVCDYTMIK